MPAAMESSASQVATSSAVAGASDTRNAGLDKETRLMMLGYGMLNLLDERMSDLMDVMQGRNERAAQLKDLIAEMNDLAAKFDSKSKPESELNYKKMTPEGQRAMETLGASLERLGVPGLENLVKDGKTIKKSELDAAISKVTGMMDSDATIQQLEMFTLQSVFSKRNEMFELMSNAMKKCQDTKSSLVRNF